MCYNYHHAKGAGVINRLIDKIALLLICLAAFSLSSSFEAPVIGLLTALGASLLTQYFGGTRAASVIIAGFACMCGLYPIVFCAAPIMLYDALCEKKWYLFLPAVGVLAGYEQLKPMQLILSLIGIFVALLFYMRISRLEEAVHKLTDLRDVAAEQNIRLKEHNQKLLVAQDNEIHLATLKERNRIAREIHDNVGHMLTRSLLQAGALMVINRDENLKEPLQSLKDTLDSAMTNIRQSVHDLHDDSIDLKAVADECLSPAREKFEVSFEYDVENDLPAPLRLCFIGIIKEAVSNAVKYSAGDRFGVVIREHPAFYQLAIEDNGPCGEIGESGIGLKNMRERAQNVGGLISINAAPTGFKIFLSVRKEQ